MLREGISVGIFVLVYNWCTVYERGFITRLQLGTFWAVLHQVVPMIHVENHVENHHVLKWHFRSRYVSEQSPESLESFKPTAYT